jgi:2Fe-2S ferredoxin
MPKVTFVDHEGHRTEVEPPVGWSLMQAATLNGIPGIEGECGGSLSCATCHCYIEEAKLPLIPSPSPMELEMLDYAASERKPNSRLGCQVKLTEALDGIVVDLPETQS